MTTDTPEINQYAAETVSSLARLITAAALPTLREQIAAQVDDRLNEIQGAYNKTFQTHLEIMQSQGRRIDALRSDIGDLADTAEKLAEEIDQLSMRTRLYHTKTNQLDEARASHQNSIAHLFDELGLIQESLTIAEASIADLENPKPIPAPPPQPRQVFRLNTGNGELTVGPAASAYGPYIAEAPESYLRLPEPMKITPAEEFAGILHGYNGTITISTKRPQTEPEKAAAAREEAHRYISNWVKDWSYKNTYEALAAGRPSRAIGIRFNDIGIAEEIAPNPAYLPAADVLSTAWLPGMILSLGLMTSCDDGEQLASSDEEPQSCADHGAWCCPACNPCCACGKLR